MQWSFGTFSRCSVRAASEEAGDGPAEEHEWDAAGRGLGEPTLAITHHPDHAVVRVDCEENPEFWFELRLPAATLEAWAKAQRAAEAGREGG